MKVFDLDSDPGPAYCYPACLTHCSIDCISATHFYTSSDMTMGVALFLA